MSGGVHASILVEDGSVGMTGFSASGGGCAASFQTSRDKFGATSMRLPCSSLLLCCYCWDLPLQNKCLLLLLYFVIIHFPLKMPLRVQCNFNLHIHGTFFLIGLEGWDLQKSEKNTVLKVTFFEYTFVKTGKQLCTTRLISRNHFSIAFFFS